MSFSWAFFYFFFNGTISAFAVPLGGTKAKIESLKVGFRFHAISETDCGRASSVRLVITILRGRGLLPVVNPDLPVEIALPERVVVAQILIDEVLAGVHR